ncbi:MAG TPA: IscS subfamily cysteine desulfurase [Chitinophagaceae bacterium]|nr:IscS subfamily cysteine desulfurase [Chitinophagaceae bacterium]
MCRLPIYLDHNATTPCDPRVVEAMLPYFAEHFGNAASRNHMFGWEAEEAVNLAREQVATLIGAEPGEIIFTSGATEADNLALKGVFETYTGKGNHIITCNIEHRAVLDPCRHLEMRGADVTYLRVGNDGLINLDELESAFKPGTILVAIMYANNEIGTLMPIKQISAIAKSKGVLLFTDATQAVGKIPVDVDKDGIDLMAFNAHKIYGPKGIGALFVRRKNPRVKLTAQMDGGGHEKGMRSGTLNVPGIIGFGKACEICKAEMTDDGERMNMLRNKLENALVNIGEVCVNGSTKHRLPHVSNMAFLGAEAENLMMALNKDLAVSSGSACMSASLEPSYVLKALGLTDEISRSSLRFSLGRDITEEEIDYAIKAVGNSLDAVRNINPSFNVKI